MLGLIDTDLKQTRRFGASLTLAHEQQIRRLSLEQAEALSEALLDFQTPDDLGAWLASREAPPI